jgi:ornithine cyclodeaminase
MKFITADTIYNSVSYTHLVETLLGLHQEGPSVLNDTLLGNTEDKEADNFMLIRAAFSSGKAIGIKMASIFPANKSIPTVQGVFVIFDGVNGTPIGIFDGTALTHRKTAAASALGSNLLSRSNSSSFLMVGAGAMSAHLIRAHLAVRPSLTNLKIWNRSSTRAHSIAHTLSDEGINISPVTDLQTAVNSADIICCATMSHKPIIKGQWLKKGAHLDLVGAYKLNMREADDDCFRRGKLFVDNRKTTLGEIGEIDIPLKAGIINEQSIIADFYDMCLPDFIYRRKDEDITVFKNGGGGHLDLMIARIILQASAA